MTLRAVRDDVQNVLDYLTVAELANYANPISMTSRRITWNAPRPGGPFLTKRGHPDLEQYVAWLEAGQYSAVLFDGSLIQVTYDLEHGKLIHHRLAYIPCPYEVDRRLVEDGLPFVDIMELYSGEKTSLRSPLRFDYSPEQAGPRHPPAHMTFNSVDCRIACAAPMHILRFVDFVFRNFYPALWRAHKSFFAPAPWRHIGDTIAPDRTVAHLNWDYNATRAQVLRDSEASLIPTTQT